jgi:NF-kappa-B inhibitor delta
MWTGVCGGLEGDSQLSDSTICSLQDPLDTRLYAEPSGPQTGSWRISGLPSGPPQLPPPTGPSLDTARAHMLALGPQQLLAQDEEGDT